jgi:hypothetical protein
MGYKYIAGSAGGGVTGFGDLFSSMLTPGPPTAGGVGNEATQPYYGYSPEQQIQLQNLQNKLAQTTNAKQQGKIQDQINNLQTKISDTSQLGYESQFLKNLQTSIPQLQQIANAQNAGSAAGAVAMQQQYGLPAGQAILGAQQQLAPQFYQNQTALGNTLGANIGPGGFQGLTPAQTAYYNQQFMGNQAAMGLGSSPLGAQNAADQLTGLNLQQANTQEAQMQNYLNNYLQPTVPNLFGSTYSPQSATSLGGNTLSALSPQDYLSLASSLAGVKYGQEQQMAQAWTAPMTDSAIGLMSAGGASPSGMQMAGGNSSSGFDSQIAAANQYYAANPVGSNYFGGGGLSLGGY